MSDLAISISHVAKRYRLGQLQDPYGRLTETIWKALADPFRRSVRRPTRSRELWALSDVSFDVRRGDVVGVIGRNGAGKSTLLKILSRITEPTSGRVVMTGRVASLLEVGTGFHPELSGRENIYLSGAILGMRRAEIRRKFDEIVAFSEVERFLDTPVKRYSSGMQVRLGFSVAAHLEPEILIVDEVLAVGDAAFQRRCLAKMEDVTHEGRTVLFVSHNMASVESLCTRAVLLEFGRVVADGGVREIVDQYLHSIESLPVASIADREDRHGSGKLRFTGIQSSMRLGAESEIRLEYAGESPIKNVEVSLGLFTLRGEGCLYLANHLTGDELALLPEVGTMVCQFDRALLMPGIYSMNVYCTVNGDLADWVQDAARIEVAEGDFFGTGKIPPPGYGNVVTPHRWIVEEAG
jgi:lipopolysaccharide transport system ATP-binding protein